jgi:glycolate oxidase
MHDAVIEQFRSALAEGDAVITDLDSLADAGHDYWGFGGVPGLMLRPRTRDEVAEIMRIASEHGVPVVPRGGASNCSAGMMSARDRVLLDLSAFDRLLDVDVTGRRARVEPGIINGDLQQQLAAHGLCFSPDPVSAPMSTVGGNIIENAGGPHALKYGVTYNHVLSVDVVLPDGTTMTFAADDDGPDLLGVVIGSEGTLGVVVEATVALRPVPEVTRSLMGAFASASAAADTVTAIIATGVVPAALEWLDQAGVAGLERFTSTGYPTDAAAILLVDVDGSADEVHRELPIIEQVLRDHATEVRRADDEGSRAELWHGRLRAPESVLRSGQAFYIGDVTVPRPRIPEMQRAIQEAAERHSYGLSFIAVVGHAGDGDLHPTSFYDRSNPRALDALHQANAEIIDAALSMGGTITGEHGVGTGKREFMTKRFTPTEIAVQRAIKTAFDPAGLLNPGVMLPDHSPEEPPAGTVAVAVRAALARVTPQRDITLTTGNRTDIAFDIANLVVVVGADATLADLAHQLDEHGVTCTAVPHPADDRTIGQLVATANGTVRVGVRHSLLGVDAVMPDGTKARFGGENMKDVAGYDTKRLFIGGAGAFGALEALIFKISVCRR